MYSQDLKQLGDNHCWFLFTITYFHQSSAVSLLWHCMTLYSCGGDHVQWLEHHSKSLSLITATAVKGHQTSAASHNVIIRPHSQVKCFLKSDLCLDCSLESLWQAERNYLLTTCFTPWNPHKYSGCNQQALHPLKVMVYNSCHGFKANNHTCGMYTPLATASEAKMG